MPDEDGFNTLFGDLRLKLYLYMGNTVLFINQNNTIKNVMEKINDDSSVFVVVVDFKMKFETMTHHENDVGNFVKRDISWHGILVFYYFLVYVDPDLYEMRQCTICINHINVFDHKQDSACVVSLIEAILNCIKRILPYINGLIL